ncbi:uncharacterized protein CCOS01_11727 [Colletotrichum costaricense]|uniref:Uncharacterized protein n=1 Tax=Colletotrichum costaricense TaxID=1209916 RepID=A0AAJ0DWU6_9PEZI|nr:uncharacterized protein CCOS01_11727 [Colletotrichum costaricense]KAK1518907.1 hypothetical protein CCOS01_11727 [Colletotrichum costaricense]
MLPPSSSRVRFTRTRFSLMLPWIKMNGLGCFTGFNRSQCPIPVARVTRLPEQVFVPLSSAVRADAIHDPGAITPAPVSRFRPVSGRSSCKGKQSTTHSFSICPCPSTVCRFQARAYEMAFQTRHLAQVFLH